jgi:hypothetical protein
MRQWTDATSSRFEPLATADWPKNGQTTPRYQKGPLFRKVGRKRGEKRPLQNSRTGKITYVRNENVFYRVLL